MPSACTTVSMALSLPEQSESPFGGLFEGLLDGAVAATAPMAWLVIGLLVHLTCGLFQRTERLQPFVFVGALVAAFLAELNLLAAGADPVHVLGGTLLSDRSTALWGCIFLLSTGLTWVFSIGYYQKDRAYKPEHDALLLAAPVGMMLMVGAANLVVFFVGLETLSIPLYALAAFRRARADSIEAGVKYFLLGSFASAFLVYGASLLYADSGTLDVARLMAANHPTSISAVGAALLASGLFFKVSVFPFHLWVPDVYEGSPTPIAALMATGTKAAAFGFLIRAAHLLPEEAATTVATVAIITMLVGNLGAMAQDDLKRMLAYSGIAHAGTVLLLVAASLAAPALTPVAIGAAIFYMGAYLFAATGAFGVVSTLEADGDACRKIESLRGLAQSRPGLCAALVVFLLSLAGIPATGGFMGKWFVFSTLVSSEFIGFAVLGIVLSVVAVAYYLRVVVVMTMHPADSDPGAPAGLMRPRIVGYATAFCCILSLAMGLAPGWFLGS